MWLGVTGVWAEGNIMASSHLELWRRVVRLGSWRSQKACPGSQGQSWSSWHPKVAPRARRFVHVESHDVFCVAAGLGGPSSPEVSLQLRGPWRRRGDGSVHLEVDEAHPGRRDPGGVEEASDGSRRVGGTLSAAKARGAGLGSEAPDENRAAKAARS